jgi:hypothetical protein
MKTRATIVAFAVLVGYTIGGRTGAILTSSIEGLPIRIARLPTKHQAASRNYIGDV